MKNCLEENSASQAAFAERETVKWQANGSSALLVWTEHKYSAKPSSTLQKQDTDWVGLMSVA